MPMVKVVKDEETGRLRVKPYRKEGWVRFPKKLREEGAVYHVEELIELEGTKNGVFWVASGEIHKQSWRKVSNPRKRKTD